MTYLQRAFTLIMLCLPLAAYSSAAESVPGLQREMPTAGRYVRVENGFMVPYSLTIPGTDVVFSMEPIPSGRPWLGSPASEAGRRVDEGPQVAVSLAPYWIGKHEVTWAEYKEFMSLYAVFKDFQSKNVRRVTADNLADAITAPTELYDPSFTFEHGEDPRQPAVTMTQYAAKQYTKWLSAVSGHQYRLPSEVEWEHACRAGTTTAYHFGDDASQLDQYAWFYGNAGEMPQPVGRKKPNPWGLHDMHGNVWEWVLDEYSEQGYARLDGRPVTGIEAIAWPTKLYPRVLRGGSWDDDPPACRSAAKLASHDLDWKSEDPNLPLSPWWFTSDPSRGVGFRLVRPLSELPHDQMARYWEADVEDIKFDVQNRLDEGRGVLGLVDEKLPAAIRRLSESK